MMETGEEVIKDGQVAVATKLVAGDLMVVVGLADSVELSLASEVR